MPTVPARAVMRDVDDDREWGLWHEAAEQNGLWDDQQPDPLKNLNIHLELVLVSDEGSSKAAVLSSFSAFPVIVVILIAIIVFLAVKYLHVACLWCIRRRMKAEEAEFCRDQSEDLDASTVSTSPISRDVTAPVHRVSIPNDITVVDEEKKREEGERGRQEGAHEQPGLEERQDQFLEMLEGGKVYQTTNQDWDLSYGSYEKKKIFRSKSEAVPVNVGRFPRQIFDTKNKDWKLGYDNFEKKNNVTE